MKRRALSMTSVNGVDSDLPRNFGTMQNVHLPLQPSCTFRYARAVRVGSAADEARPYSGMFSSSPAVFADELSFFDSRHPHTRMGTSG